MGLLNSGVYHLPRIKYESVDLYGILFLVKAAAFDSSSVYNFFSFCSYVSQTLHIQKKDVSHLTIQNSKIST